MGTLREEDGKVEEEFNLWCEGQGLAKAAALNTAAWWGLAVTLGCGGLVREKTSRAHSSAPTAVAR